MYLDLFDFRCFIKYGKKFMTKNFFIGQVKKVFCLSFHVQNNIQKF